MAEEFTLNSLKVLPETSPIQDPVKISFDYTLAATFTDWEWIIRYTVDVAYKRMNFDLYREKAEMHGPGKFTKELYVPKIALEEVHIKDLMNIGLLSICGVKDGKEIATINIVSQITKNNKNELMKTLLSPLD